MQAPAEAGRVRVLVTGAGGFVGRALARGLGRFGLEPVLLDRSFDEDLCEELYESCGEGCGRAGPRLIRADLRDAPDPDAYGPLEYLIHGAALTAEPAACGLSDAQHLNENVSLGLAALALAQRAGVKRAILISSAGVFSPRHAGPLDEDARPDATGPYATAKRMLELAGESLRARGALDVASVRLGNLYGPLERVRPSRPRLSLLASMAAEARREGRVTVDTPDALRDWTLVEDLPGAFAALLREPELPAGVLHLANPETVRDEQLAGRVAEWLEPELGPVKLALADTAPLESPAASPVRPPLLSRYAGALVTPAWTNFADGLARTLGTPEAVTA